MNKLNLFSKKKIYTSFFSSSTSYLNLAERNNNIKTLYTRYKFRFYLTFQQHIAINYSLFFPIVTYRLYRVF